ncbi:hypothetical protein C162_26800 [Paenibacillus sp. FSL R7-269]|uniref:hypothetical protein n=1 Tax=Paenibacillus sp. FSL R7-269 TaxID=1226755 RepID=UPI0003E26FDE|nr:hypothetical protein [Paenibacillus sp. FSL R7-269]ETT40936.1 hypothetical protein C162_26800 [Paenibacillus sp. FSL R7-269]
MSEVPVTTEVNADSDEIVDVKSSLTVGLALSKSAQLPTAAHDVAAFINTIRDLTGEDYALDVRVQIGPATEAGRNSDGTAVVGFALPTQADEEEDDYGRDTLH